tara:strand:- start:825 stop:1391 length:567 start_codon:yes stop_codon:yes gene_type:complete
MYKLLDEQAYRFDKQQGLLEENIGVENYKEKYREELCKGEAANFCAKQFTFALVRDPLAKIYSAYKNKTLTTQPNSAIVNLFAKHGIDRDIPFDLFIEQVCSIPDKNLDRHLRSQSWFLSENDKLLPVTIIKLENISTEWERVEEQTGLRLPDKLNSTNPSPLPKLDKEHSQMFRNKYHLDYELLGYE